MSGVLKSALDLREPKNIGISRINTCPGAECCICGELTPESRAFPLVDIRFVAFNPRSEKPPRPAILRVHVDCMAKFLGIGGGVVMIGEKGGKA